MAHRQHGAARLASITVSVLAHHPQRLSFAPKSARLNIAVKFEATPETLIRRYGSREVVGLREPPFPLPGRPAQASIVDLQGVGWT
jgi:hypothetical protein